ncbi:MAG: trigger factor [Alphaproteobacteria bacterium]|nr:trigger factor [Alphaproteobacteria bacterium]
MKVSEEKSKGLTLKFKATIEAADFEKQVQLQIQKLAKQTKLPGFRPGKAPTAIINQKFRSTALGEALDSAIQKGVSDILTQKKLRVAHEPNVKIEKFEEGKDIEFSMEVETLPEVKLGDFSKIKLEKPMAVVPDEEINKSLEYVAQSRRDTEVVTQDRAAKKGDIVVIDFTGAVNGVEFKGGKGTDYPLELGSNSFIPGFEDQLIGAKKGDKKDVNVTFPKDYHAKDLAGKDAVFAVEVKELRTLKKVEINDEFAKSLGAKDLADLKAKVAERIKEDYETAAKMKLKRALLDVLDKEYKFELPETLVKAEYDGILKQYEHAKEHGELDEYEKSKKEKDLLKEYQEIAQRRVKLGLILSEVGADQKIQITSDDLNKAIMNEARKYPGQEKAVFDFYLKNKNAIESLKAPVMEEKIVDAILSKAQITEKTVSVKELYTFDDK